jgi:hypothetical protein
MTKKELIKYALERGMPPDTIVKDWVLGNFLKALFSKKYYIWELYKT